MKVKKKIIKSNKYAFGSFVAPGSQATALAGSLIGDNAAGNFLSGAGSLASTGAALGPWGAAAGAVIGGTLGVIGGAARRKQMRVAEEKANADYISNYTNQINATADTVNINPYGMGATFELGGMIGDSTKVNRNIDPSMLSKRGILLVQKKDGTIGEWGNDIKPKPVIPVKPIPRTNWQPNVGVDQARRFPIQHADGGDITNTESNIINIEKGELLIDPESGKILQEYNGINPLTGGLFEPHAKKGKDTKHNLTMADPGLFVITKAKAKDYKKSVDNNDKIAQKTTLMNIRNKKIEKEGGLTKYASGSTVRGPELGVISKGVSLNPTIANPDISGFDIAMQGTPNIQAPTEFDFNTLAQSLPGIYNIAQGLFGTTQKQAYGTPAINPYTRQILGNMPQDVDMSSITRDIYTNQRVADNNISNNTNSSAIARANRNQLTSNTSRALAGANLNSQMANNQIRSQRANTYNILGSQAMQDQANLRGYNLQVDDINNRRDAAKGNMLNTGLEQIQQVYANKKANDRRAALEKYALELQQLMNPATRFYNQFNPTYNQ